MADKIKVERIQNTLTRRQYSMMWGVFWFAVVSFTVMLSMPFILFNYPFKAITFVIPVEVLNPDKKVQCNGIVDLKIYYEKDVASPGLTIRTLGYEKNGKFHALDSSTVVSDLPKGKGEADEFYVLTTNPAFIGKNRKIVFSIYHWMFGFRPVMEQYASEFFEITECKEKK